jgi:hypothetical protein
MAGVTTLVDYVSDTGVTCRTRIPAWVATLQGASTGTSTVTCPKGLRKRVRYVRVTATGREHKLVVPDVGATFWTEGFGTSHTIPTLGSGTATAVTSEGRTGEKTRDI